MRLYLIVNTLSNFQSASLLMDKGVNFLSNAWLSITLIFTRTVYIEGAFIKKNNLNSNLLLANIKLKPHSL